MSETKGQLHTVVFSSNHCNTIFLSDIWSIPCFLYQYRSITIRWEKGGGDETVVNRIGVCILKCN